ncbi:hypothetical protein Hanom_Chr11g01039701 [Helianthus anomalus]
MVDSLFEFVEQVRQENAAGQRRLEDGMKVIMDHFQLQPPPSSEAGFEEDWGGGER